MKRSVPKIFSAAALLAAAALAAGGCSRAPSCDVLLVTVDTLRADRVGCYGYEKAQTPIMDGLAAEGVLFEHAVTPAPITLAAHASIMTGKYPPTHGARNNGIYTLGPGHATLAEQFQRRGCATAAFLAAAPLLRASGLQRGFDFYDDAFLDAPDRRAAEDILYPAQRPAEEVFASARRWFAQNGGKPYFAWIHLYDPHTPYHPPASFRDAWRRKVNEAAGYTLLQAFYDGEVSYADAELGQFLKWLDSRSPSRRRLLVLASDHGEGLGDHGEPTHGFFLYESTTHVPLIFHGGPLPQDGGGRRVRETVNLVDLAPTILELAGLSAAPLKAEGASLAPVLMGKQAGPPARDFYGETLAAYYEQGWAPAFALWSGGFKYIRLPRPELYDLGTDPREEGDIFLADAERVKRMEKALAAMEKNFPESENPSAPDAQARARLESLGYIGHRWLGGSSGKFSWKGLPDPKDRVAMFAPAQQAMDLMFAGEPAKALPFWERALAAAPENRNIRLEKAKAHLMLGQAAEAEAEAAALESWHGLSAPLWDLRARTAELRGDMNGAETFYRRALALDGEFSEGRLALAALYRRSGQNAKAKTELEIILTALPRHAGALAQMGFLADEAGDAAAARDFFRRSLESAPSAPAWLGAARMELRAQRPDRAFTLLQEALKQEPRNPELHYAMAQVQAQTGNAAGERQAYENFLRYSHPGDPRRKEAEAMLKMEKP